MADLVSAHPRPRPRDSNTSNARLTTSCERADAPDQAVRKFDGECQFGFAGWDRLFQPLRLFEVAIGLTRRYGTVLGQLLDRSGELIDMQQQIARAIEALGSLGIAGAWHLS